MQTFRSIRHASIWGSESVDHIDDRVKFQLRVGLPMYDMFLVCFGVFSGIGGTPALRDTFGDAYANSWGWLLAFSAVVAFVGVAFPNKFWRIEFAAKSFIIGLLTVYAFALFGLAAFTPPYDLGRGGVGFGLLAMAVLPVIRSADIIRDKEIHGWR